MCTKQHISISLLVRLSKYNTLKLFNVQKYKYPFSMITNVGDRKCLRRTAKKTNSFNSKSYYIISMRSLKKIRDMDLMAYSSNKHLLIKIFYKSFVASYVLIKGNYPLRAHQHIQHWFSRGRSVNIIYILNYFRIRAYFVYFVYVCCVNI